MNDSDSTAHTHVARSQTHSQLSSISMLNDWKYLMHSIELTIAFGLCHSQKRYWFDARKHKESSVRPGCIHLALSAILFIYSHYQQIQIGQSGVKAERKQTMNRAEDAKQILLTTEAAFF